MRSDVDPLVALAERLQALCLGRSLTVATAESCTGGLVANLITEVDGSSGYFLGGVVSYSDEAKRGLLDVPSEAIDAHGAVSAQVARSMAEGGRARFGARCRSR
jgi:PncC family amidohydrolase